MKYEIVLFDIDDTLLDFPACGKASLRRCFDWHGLPFEDACFDAYLRVSTHLWREMELGHLTQKEVLETRFVDLFRELAISDVDIVQFEKDYRLLLSEEHITTPGALEIIRYLQGKGCRIYLVSNSEAETQVERIRRSGIAPYIQGMFTADMVGSQKPAPQFFRYCFERIPDFDAARTIIVGDSLTSDMAGGSRAGIATCWYHPHTMKNPLQIPYDYEILNFEELKKIIK